MVVATDLGVASAYDRNQCGDVELFERFTLLSLSPALPADIGSLFVPLESSTTAALTGKLFPGAGSSLSTVLSFVRMARGPDDVARTPARRCPLFDATGIPTIERVDGVGVASDIPGMCSNVGADAERRARIAATASRMRVSASAAPSTAGTLSVRSTLRDVFFPFCVEVEDRTTRLTPLVATGGARALSRSFRTEAATSPVRVSVLAHRTCPLFSRPGTLPLRAA